MVIDGWGFRKTNGRNRVLGRVIGSYPMLCTLPLPPSPWSRGRWDPRGEQNLPVNKSEVSPVLSSISFTFLALKFTLKLREKKERVKKNESKLLSDRRSSRHVIQRFKTRVDPFFKHRSLFCTFYLIIEHDLVTVCHGTVV